MAQRLFRRIGESNMFRWRMERDLFRWGFFILFLGATCVSSEAFPLKVRGIDTTRTAVLIHDLRFGVDIVSENIDKSLIPASIMKSVTVGALLNLADTQERFSTPVVAEGSITDSVLHGNLIVKTCGDPTIESQYFTETQGFADSIAVALHRMGVKQIEGMVEIDQSDFPDATTPPGWMAEDIPWYYGARLQGANFRDNRFRMRLPSKETSPYVPDIKFSFSRPSARRIKVDRKDGSETFLVSGNVRRRGYNDVFATPYPWKVMQHEITSTLDGYGISVNGKKMNHGSQSVMVYEHKSPTFTEIMRSLMHRSDNLMAEGMLRAITPGGTRADAITEENAVWTMAGISAHGVTIVDGSGLSRDNRLTARFLRDIYKYMMSEEFADDYTSLFPRAGNDGTMKYFLLDTPLEGRVAMKTGSMKGVQSYAGYLFDEDGHPTHILIFIANGFRCSRAALKNDIQRLLLEKFNVSLQSN